MATGPDWPCTSRVTPSAVSVCIILDLYTHSISCSLVISHCASVSQPMTMHLTKCLSIRCSFSPTASLSASLPHLPRRYASNTISVSNPLSIPQTLSPSHPLAIPQTLSLCLTHSLFLKHYLQVTHSLCLKHYLCVSPTLYASNAISKSPTRYA